MNYINAKFDGTTETVDQFESRKEAREMLAEYQLAFGVPVWVSQRSTKEWRDRESAPVMLRNQAN